MERAQRVLARRDLYTTHNLPWYYTSTRRTRNTAEYRSFVNLLWHMQHITDNKFGKSIPDIIVRTPTYDDPLGEVTTVTIRRKHGFDYLSGDVTEDAIIPGGICRFPFTDLPFVLYQMEARTVYVQRNLFSDATRLPYTRPVLDTTSIGVRHVQIGTTVYNLQSFQLPPD